MPRKSTLIHNATIVNEGRIFNGSLIFEGDRIVMLWELGNNMPPSTIPTVSETIDATGMLLMPGVIDTHVHFRDGGQSENTAGNFATESAAALAGGVTSVIDMPNTNPQTTTLEALSAKEQLAQRCSKVNYGFMLGATNDNIDALLRIPPQRYAAIKLFLGSSTGNMLVSDEESLVRLFSNANRKLIVAHCEREDIIQTNLRAFRAQFQGTPDEKAALHPRIRNTEACFLSTYHAIELARKYDTRLHIAHISTATELSLLSNYPTEQKHITAEVTPNHLWFDDRDYATLGNLIKCNPAIKTSNDRLALWAALQDGLIDTIATDHAPHPIEAKRKPYFDAPSGIPSIQHSLQMMLEYIYNPQSAADAELREQWLPLIVQKMCHAPANLFRIADRGYLRPGYKADLVLVRPGVEHTVQRSELLSRCGWSPIEGNTLHTQIEHVWVNGCDTQTAAEPLLFT